MGRTVYLPTFTIKINRSWIGKGLPFPWILWVGNKLLITYPSFVRKAGSDGRLAGHFTKLAELQRPARTWEDWFGVVVMMMGLFEGVGFLEGRGWEMICIYIYICICIYLYGTI